MLSPIPCVPPTHHDSRPDISYRPFDVTPPSLPPPAGATSVEITVREYGRDGLEVGDDGCGVAAGALLNPEDIPPPRGVSRSKAPQPSLEGGGGNPAASSPQG